MIGDLIKEERTKQGITIRHLADKVGISASYLSDMENGNRNVPLKTLVKINDALGVTLVNKDYLNYINGDYRKALLNAAKEVSQKNLIDVELGNPFNTPGIEREIEVYQKVEKAIIKVLKEFKEKDDNK